MLQAWTRHLHSLFVALNSSIQFIWSHQLQQNTLINDIASALIKNIALTLQLVDWLSFIIISFFFLIFILRTNSKFLLSFLILKLSFYPRNILDGSILEPYVSWENSSISSHYSQIFLVVQTLEPSHLLTVTSAPFFPSLWSARSP